MKQWIAFALVLATAGADAQTAYRWIDKEGKVHYSDHPPPPAQAQRIEQKKLEAPGSSGQNVSALTRQAMTDFPVTLFTTPDCGDPCKHGRDFLARRAVPYTEKSLQNQDDVTALRTVMGEAPTKVPVMRVGARVAKGYQSQEWETLLDAAGYPKPGTSASAESR